MDSGWGSWLDWVCENWHLTFFSCSLVPCGVKGSVLCKQHDGKKWESASACVRACAITLIRLWLVQDQDAVCLKQTIYSQPALLRSFEMKWMSWDLKCAERIKKEKKQNNLKQVQVSKGMAGRKPRMQRQRTYLLDEDTASCGEKKTPRDECLVLLCVYNKTDQQ